MTQNNPSLRVIRIKKFLSSWLPAIVVALLLLGSIGIAVAYQTQTTPPVERTEETVSSWEETTRVSHQARVEQPNLVFEQNQTLQDRPVYYTRLSPRLEVIHEYSYTATDGGELTVDTDATLLMRALDADDNVYWQRTEPLATTTETVAPGETATLSVEINVTAVAEEIERTEASLGASIGTTELGVSFERSVGGEVNGEPVASAHRDAIAVDPGDNTFSIDGTDGSQQRHDQTATVETVGTHGTLRSYGPYVVLFLSLLGVAGMLAGRYTGHITPTEQELATLEHQRERAEFDDWTSRAAVPADAVKTDAMTVETLEDLVDIAIDTDERVLEDTRGTGFYVLGTNANYMYSPTATVRPLAWGEASDLTQNGDSPNTENPAHSQPVSKHDDGNE